MFEEIIKGISKVIVFFTCLFAFAVGLYKTIEINWFGVVFVMACIVCITTWKEASR